MKKIALMATAAMMLGLAASCDKTESVSRSTYYVDTYSMASDGSGDATISQTRYTYVIDNMLMQMKMGVTGLSLGGTPLTFTTRELPAGVANIRLSQNRVASAFLMEGADATGEDGVEIRNLNVDITAAVNINNDSLLNVLKDQIALDPISYPGGSGLFSETQFKHGNYTVKTFWPDMLFTGQTTTTTGAGADPYNTKSMVYRLKIDLKTPGSYKANLYFYNAKFAASDKAPQVNFVLENLPIRFTAGGFQISATDVIPKMLKENTPNPRFIFKQIQLYSSSEDLSQIECRYNVADSYSGSFSGKCMTALSLSDFAKPQ